MITPSVISELTDDGTRLQLHLSYARSLSVVGAALATAFPTAESWDTVRSSDEFIQEMNHLAEVFRGIRERVLSAESEEQLYSVITLEYDMATSAVIGFAEKYKIPVEDLVFLLSHL